MQICLLHPTKGYYTTQPPFGAEGDFITAPEISQMFGELLGLCLAQAWLSQEAPARFTLAELGPGRGTLMADALRACRGVPGFLEAAEVVLVEASPALKAQQRETLAPYDVTWVGDVEDLPQQPLFAVANEFFDALPLRQFIREGEGWRERLVGVEDDALIWGLGAVGPQAEVDHRLESTTEGTLVEVCPTAGPVMRSLAARIAAYGGAGLVVDYGDWRRQGGSFQAVKDHAHADPLAEPGRADLTAHVDFEALAQAAAPALYTPVVPQGVFLERLGITDRAQKLAAGMTAEALEAHVKAHRRLTHPEEMGNLFKVMGVYPPHAAPPPGF
jgi:SAM-dependent MidA family methyltransferase